MGEQKSMIDYIAVDEKLRKDVLDTKAVRGCYGVYLTRINFSIFSLYM